MLPALYSSAHFSSKRRMRSMSWSSSARVRDRARCTQRGHRRLQRRRVAFGQPQLPRLQQAPHDLAGAVLRDRRPEIDLLRRDRGAEPRAGEAEELALSASLGS